jgi:hypothetical protein
MQLVSHNRPQQPQRLTPACEIWEHTGCSHYLQWVITLVA